MAVCYTTSMQYPSHLQEDVRMTIAAQVIEKELLKLAPDIPADAITKQIAKWQQNPADFHLKDSLQDFWDIVAAVMESVKLKSSFTAFLTAKNYTWQQAEIPVESIQFSTCLHQLTLLPALHFTAATTAKAVLSAITTPEQLAEQRAINDSHNHESQNNYPIIVRQMPDGTQKVMDGNRRVLRAALYEQPTISAWIAHADSELPKDFWVPVNDLLQIVKLYRLCHTNDEKQSIRNSLELLFRASACARITYKSRVAKANQRAQDLLALTPTI